MLIEIIGVLALILSLLGVILNNRRFRVCFLIWLMSNTLCAIIHASTCVWSLMIRDLIFLVLAIEGWFKWRKKKNELK